MKIFISNFLISLKRKIYDMEYVTCDLALKTVEADIERYMAEGLAIDKAEDAIYGGNRTGRELPKRVKQALETKRSYCSCLVEART
jgi:hypothetical protein